MSTRIIKVINFGMLWWMSEVIVYVTTICGFMKIKNKLIN